MAFNKINFLIISSLFVALIVAQKNDKQSQPKEQPINSNSTEPQLPTIDWGKCPQLEPKPEERETKLKILENCLKENPVPKNLTDENFEQHQKQIAECALKKEKWFTKNGNYKFSKAEGEIKKKALTKPIESQLLKHHKKCETEAKTEFKKKTEIIAQIQLYQACMDFHITDTCGIKVVEPQPQQ